MVAEQGLGTWEEMEREMASDLERGYPETWNWEEHGPEVMGVALRKETATTVNGPCEVLVIKWRNPKTNEYVERSIWLFHEALRSKMYRLQPRVGDFVGIRQLGEREPKTAGGRSYMDYSVKVLGKTGTALAWGEQPSIALPSGEPGEVEAEVVEESGSGIVGGAPADSWGAPSEPPDQGYEGGNW